MRPGTVMRKGGRVAARAVAVIALSWAAGGAAHAQTTTLAGVVRGEEDQAPLFSAHVTLRVRPAAVGGAVPSRSTVTADGGTFHFDALPTGWADLVVRRLGFRPETLTVELPQIAGGRIVVPLSRVSEVMRPVVVRAAATPRGILAGYEHRRTAGFGHFVTRTDIERRRPQRTTDLLRTVPGLTLERTEAGQVMPRFRNATNGFQGGRCDPNYWLDGTPLGPSLDLDALPPQAIEGIELYSGIATVPAALRGLGRAGSCGVIAIWTRHGERSSPRGENQAPAELVDRSVADGRAFTAEQVDAAAAPLPGGLAAPHYPDSLRAAGATGRVLVEFIVGVSGAVEPETVGIVSSTHALFADAVREAVSAGRFAPAMRGGRAVRQVVQLPVVFSPEGAAPR
jgi:TonB family protein